MRLSNFGDYLWFLAPAFMKRARTEDGDNYKLFRAVGKIADNLKLSILNIRRQAIITTSTGKALDMHGKDRNIKRYANESDESYRKRLQQKRLVVQYAGTIKGILAAVNTLGYENTIHRRTFFRDTSKWAEFDLIFDENTMDAIDDFNLTRSIVREVKQASSKPNYGFKLYCKNTEFDFSVSLRVEQSLWLLDGSYRLDGSKTLDNLKILEDIEMAKTYITTIGKEKMAKARAGDKVLPKITHFAVGIGGIDSEGQPREPTIELYNEVLRKQINTHALISPTICRYTLILDRNELLEVNINELALIDAEGDLIVTKTFKSKYKDNTMDMIFEIDDEF